MKNACSLVTQSTIDDKAMLLALPLFVPRSARHEDGPPWRQRAGTNRVQTTTLQDQCSYDGQV